MAYIEMKNSTKLYHMGSTTITANDNVSFTIEQGELAIILGASGAGKSTVLNILGGMDANTSGQVIIDGKDISNYRQPAQQGHQVAPFEDHLLLFFQFFPFYAQPFFNPFPFTQVPQTITGIAPQGVADG